MKFIRRATLTERPAHVPPGALVFNATRPLYGTLVDDGAAMTWQSGFLAGVHYAAISPDDPYRAEWLRHNQEMHACLVWYVSEAEAKELARQRTEEYIESHPKFSISGGIDRFLDCHWKYIFFNHFDGKEVEVDSDTLSITPVW